MIADVSGFDPDRVAAVLYRPQDDVDKLLTDFALDRLRAGERIGGVVQSNLRDAGGSKVGMEAIDLMTGHPVSICQPLGKGAMACKLDASGLAEAAMAVARAIETGVDLIVINKFSKQEASGGGLRNELADAAVSGIPVLTAVPEKVIDAWKAFTGDQVTLLRCEQHVVEGWWRSLRARMAPVRDAPAHAPAVR